MAIDSIGSLNLISPPVYSTEKVQSTESNGNTFADFLKDAVGKVNDLILESDSITNDFAAGKTDNIHQVLIAAEKADVALQFAMQIRNKIFEAYYEIMRMQI